MIESSHKNILFSKYLKWHWYSNQTDHSASVQYWIDLTHTRRHTGIWRRITTIEIFYNSMYRVYYTENIIFYLHLKLMKLYNTNNNTKTRSNCQTSCERRKEGHQYVYPCFHDTFSWTLEKFCLCWSICGPLVEPFESIWRIKFAKWSSCPISQCLDSSTVVVQYDLPSFY